MFEMGSHDSFGHLKHKLWPEKGLGIEWAIWLQTIKSQKSTQFPYMQVTCDIPWKALDEGYNFTLNLILIRGLIAKLWAPKVAKVPTLAISGLPLGNPETKCHLNVGFVERHRVYYKGEGDGFPQVRVVVNFVNPSCPWLILAPKVLQLCTNHFVLVLCKSVWVVNACHSS
jgi:hypothetical protein